MLRPCVDISSHSPRPPLFSVCLFTFRCLSVTFLYLVQVLTAERHLRHSFGSLERADFATICIMAPPEHILARLLRERTCAVSPTEVAAQIVATELAAQRVAKAYHDGDLPLFDLIVPDGLYAKMRKDLSHRGMMQLEKDRRIYKTDWFDIITQEWYRDPTNLVYGCAGRYLNQFIDPRRPLHGWLSCLGDEKIGDLFEALLGHSWLVRTHDLWMWMHDRHEARTTILVVEAFLWSIVDLVDVMHSNGFTLDLQNSRFFDQLMLRL